MVVWLGISTLFYYCKETKSTKVQTLGELVLLIDGLGSLVFTRGLPLVACGLATVVDNMLESIHAIHCDLCELWRENKPIAVQIRTRLPRPGPHALRTVEAQKSQRMADWRCVI